MAIAVTLKKLDFLGFSAILWVLGEEGWILYIIEANNRCPLAILNLSINVKAKFLLKRNLAGMGFDSVDDTAFWLGYPSFDVSSFFPLGTEEFQFPQEIKRAFTFFDQLHQLDATKRND